jgi:hypothetical protein
MDDSVQYVGHQYCITGLSEQCQPCREWLISWVDLTVLSYDMILSLQHILYLYYIHDGIVK